MVTSFMRIALPTVAAVSVLALGSTANALAPSDTPIEPIPASAIQLGIDAGILDEQCILYSQVIPIFSDALGGEIAMAMDITDAYIIWSMESGWEPAGAALTLEAEAALTNFLHGCVTL